jgi:hypothetical protein
LFFPTSKYAVMKAATSFFACSTWRDSNRRALPAH